MTIENRSGAVKAEIRSVLYVGANHDELVSLRRILPAALWRAQHALTATAAIRELRLVNYDVVLCEKELEDATWAEILEIVAGVPAGPVLVVASLFADEQLWAEALNLGAYDVLAKPFEAAEVNRVLLSASRFRERRRPTRATPQTVAAAFAVNG